MDVYGDFLEENEGEVVETSNLVVQRLEGKRLDVYYAPESEKLVSVDACENFAYIRDVGEIEGFNRADYELLMEEAEKVIFEEFYNDSSDESYLDHPSGYNLPENAVGRIPGDEE
ncbi:MAG: hypothetical protein ABEJ72_06640 [Candidatus Aenigmatarchaeota archaeon]